MPENENKQNIEIGGSVEKSIITSDDQNLVTIGIEGDVQNSIIVGGDKNLIRSPYTFGCFSILVALLALLVPIFIA